MSSAVTVPVVSPPTRTLSLGGMLVLAFGAADFGLESSIVLPALPVFAQEHSASLISVSWLATGFLLASAVAVPLLGRLGDIFGRRRLLLVGLGAFTVGSLICALAGSIGVLIAGRIVQGIGAAVGPLALGIARDSLPRERIGPAIGILVGAAGAGAAIGFLLSGVLVDLFSAAAIFWFLFGVALVLLVAAVALVPDTRAGPRIPVDAGGAALLALGLAALLLAISKGNDWGWDSGRVLGLFAGSAALLAAFAAVELHRSWPLVDLAFVARHPFANAITCAFAVGAAFAVVTIVVPQLAALPTVTGYGLGYSTTETGLLLLPMAVASMVAAWVAGRFVDAVGSRRLMAAGSAVALAAYGSLILAHGSAAEIAVATGAIGVAVGLTITGIASVVVHAAPMDKTSIAVAMNAIVRTTGIAVGTAATAAIITAAVLVGPVPLPSESGFTRAFGLGAVASACALFASVLLPGRPGRGD
jgi:MFS family permease